jgi:hypothetical protein
MKKLTKILGPVAVVLLLGVLFTACPHTDAGFGGNHPSISADPIEPPAKKKAVSELRDNIGDLIGINGDEEGLTAYYADADKYTQLLLMEIFVRAGLPGYDPQYWEKSDWDKVEDANWAGAFQEVLGIDLEALIDELGLSESGGGEAEAGGEE